MAEIKLNAITILVMLALLITFVPVLTSLIGSGSNIYRCDDAVYSIASSTDSGDNLMICTNATYACVNASAPTINNSFSPPLCTNASGVSVYNESAYSGFLAYNQSASNIGLNSTETTLLGLVILVMVLAFVFVIVKESGLMKKGE